MATITIGRTLSSAVDSVTAQQGNAPWTVREMSKMVNVPFDSVVPGYDSQDRMISARYYLGATLVKTMTMTYDSAGNLTFAGVS